MEGKATAPRPATGVRWQSLMLCLVKNALLQYPPTDDNLYFNFNSASTALVVMRYVTPSPSKAYTL